LVDGVCFFLIKVNKTHEFMT